MTRPLAYPFPKTLRTLWAQEPLPRWLIDDLGLSSDATVGLLEPSNLSSVPTVAPRIQHYVGFLVKSRFESIKSVRCFDSVWPTGLRITDIPYSVKSRNLLLVAGYLASPEALMQATFGDLLSISGLGIKSLIEIATLTESAIQVHEEVTTRLARGIEGTDVGARSGSNKFDEATTDELGDVLREPWANQISEQDPRFAALLSLGQGTLEERIERVISDPSASMEVQQLLTNLPLIRQAIEQQKGKYLEDSLLELLSAIIGDDHSRVATIAERLGWKGEDPKTLQECGDALRVTRERVRQIEAKVLKRLPGHPVFLPKLDDAISLLEGSAPIPTFHAAQVLADHKISKGSFSINSLLNTAQLLGRETTLSIKTVKGQPVVVSKSTDRIVGTIIRTARALAGQAGVASVFQVGDRLTGVAEIARLLHIDSQQASEDDIRRVLRGYKECEFLGDDWFWFTDLPAGRNRLENVTKKMLSVASPQSISSIREGVRRAFHYRSISNERYRGLTVPPQSVMADFFRRHPDFRIEENDLDLVKDVDYRTYLGAGEQVLVDVMRASASGVLDRKSLVESCVARGLNENTVSIYTSYSPLIEHLGLDLWKLRGVRVDPASVEAIREQNQLRPRETRLLDYGWGTDGKLWVAWRLPRFMGGIVLGIPGAVRRYLQDRSFVAIAKESSRSIGQVVINEGGSSYGYGSFLRYAGADEGDTILAEFDLPNSKVNLSISDSNALEQI